MDNNWPFWRELEFENKLDVQPTITSNDTSYVFKKYREHKKNWNPQWNLGKLISGVSYRKSEYQYQTKYQPKPWKKYRNQTNFRMWGKYQLFTEYTASYTLARIDNTNKIPKTLGLKYQMPS